MRMTSTHAVAEWTAGLQASQLATELQAAGVAAHIVCDQ